jgi:CRISPR/Cas system endoribonuclease Cas6 (RAMP superfamily)
MGRSGYRKRWASIRKVRTVANVDTKHTDAQMVIHSSANSLFDSLKVTSSEHFCAHRFERFTYWYFSGWRRCEHRSIEVIRAVSGWYLSSNMGSLGDKGVSSLVGPSIHMCS